MPIKSAKFSSDYLPHPQVHAALLALPSVLQLLLGQHKVIASYEWATNIHSDLHYRPMLEDTRWLLYLIEDSIEQRIVIPGESDFRFQVPDGRLDVLFCHESDIHLDGSDDELLQRFMATTPFSQMCWHTSEEIDQLLP